MVERKKQQCPKCKSRNLKFGLFSNHCNDCGLTQYLTLWNEGKQYKEQKNFKELINKIFLLLFGVITVVYFVLPIIMTFDIMWYFRSQNFVTFIVGIVLIYAIKMMISGKYKFDTSKLPDPLNKKQENTVPKQIRYEICNICKNEKPENEINNYKYKNQNIKICDDCMRAVK